MEHGWSNTDGGQGKWSEIILSLCHSVHHRLHMAWLGNECGLRGESMANICLSHGKISYTVIPSLWNLMYDNANNNDNDDDNNNNNNNNNNDSARK